MNNLDGLLETTRKVFAFVTLYIEINRYAPSFRDIKDGVGMGSTSNVRYHLDLLRLRGLVAFTDKRSRSIQIVGDRVVTLTFYGEDAEFIRDKFGNDPKKALMHHLRKLASILDPSHFDICECGDYRLDHQDGNGSCRMTDGITDGYKRCFAFRLSTAAATILKTSC